MCAFVSLILAAALASAGRCADMTPKQRNTALGATAGGVAGATIWDGPGATLGGVALGGVVGNAVTKQTPRAACALQARVR